MKTSETPQSVTYRSVVAIGLTVALIGCGTQSPESARQSMSLRTAPLEVAQCFVYPFGDGNSWVHPISQPFEAFGEVQADQYHTGIDVAAPCGTPVHAVASGKVIYSANAGPMGKTLLVEHPVPTGDSVYSLYAHLQTIAVGKGATLVQKQPVGETGASGLTSGCHIHFEMKWVPNLGKGYSPILPSEQTYLDPTKYIEAHGNCGIGKCQWIECSDANPCTSDSCVDGTCAFEPNQEACNDGDTCTHTDTCSEGNCSGTPELCDDANPCTDDACVAGICNHSNNTAACDDSDDCTLEDACMEGLCVGVAKSCDDSNPCTSDECAAGQCNHGPVAGDCDDGDPCSSEDQCQDGSCIGAAVDCDDQNPCTLDDCEGGECHHESLSVACDDSDPCTINDICSDGQCTGVARCDDGLDCTVDGCVDGECVHTVSGRTSIGCREGDRWQLDGCSRAVARVESCAGCPCKNGQCVFDSPQCPTPETPDGDVIDGDVIDDDVIDDDADEVEAESAGEVNTPRNVAEFQSIVDEEETFPPSSSGGCRNGPGHSPPLAALLFFGVALALLLTRCRRMRQRD